MNIEIGKKRMAGYITHSVKGMQKIDILGNAQ
jgi:ribosomal protein S17E